jgi:hypothetical protein
MPDPFYFVLLAASPLQRFLVKASEEVQRKPYGVN